MRITLPVMAAAALISLTVGCSSNQPAASRADITSPPAPPAATTTAPSAGPSSAASVAADTIPATVMLQAEDLRGAELGESDAADWSHIVPPNPCGTRRGSDRLRLAGVIKQAMYPLSRPERPTVIVEHVARYRADGAARLLSEIRAGANRCAGPVGADKRRWQLDKASGDTLVLKYVTTFKWSDTTVTKVTVIGVTKVGDAVVTVADAGWETRSGDVQLVQKLLSAAAKRAQGLA
jgi:hypothetical protein